MCQGVDSSEDLRRYSLIIKLELCCRLSSYRASIVFCTAASLVEVRWLVTCSILVDDEDYLAAFTGDSAGGQDQLLT